MQAILNYVSPARWYMRALVHLVCLLLAVKLVYALLSGNLAPDPGKELVLESGEVAIRLLLLCLTISPLRRLFNSPSLVLWRRPLGLWAAAWMLAHASMFAIIYVELDFGKFLEEVIERPYTSVGFIALLLMAPLAVTSTRAMMRRLGRNWKKLHRLVYFAAALATLHIIWQIREEWGGAFLYSSWLVLLMGERVWRWYRRPATS